MTKTISYSYKVLNLEDPNKVLGELKKTKGVVSAEFFDETLTYVLDEWTDEYDILVTALNLCDAVGAELIIGEDQPVSDYDYDAAPIEAEPEMTEAEPETDAGDEGEDEKAEEGEDVEEDEPIKAKKVSGDEEEGDYLISARKKLKIESIVRFIELSVSLLLFVASLFFEANANTFFTIKNIFLVVAFAIAAYEIFYTAIIDVVKKRWLSDSLIVSVACIAGAVIGRLTETAALSIIYSVIKEIQTYVNGLNDLRIDEAYYTGSLPIRLAEGGGKRISELEEGDVISIAQYDILPCDCEVLSAATFDCHLVGGGFEDEFAAGDKVLAGSLLISEAITAKVVETNENSVIVKEKKAFKEKLESAQKAPGWVTIATLSLYLVAVAVSLIPPAFYAEGYAAGLLKYAAIGVLIAFIANLNYVLSSIFGSVKTALVLLKINGIEYEELSALKKVGEANSFTFDAEALTENGQVKEDAIGALKELMSLGVKNVTTDFSDCSLDPSVKKKIDFVDKSFDGEKKALVGSGKDVSLDGNGKVLIENGEISFVPYCYKVAKRAFSAKKISAIVGAIGYILTIVGAIAIAVLDPPIGVTIAAAPALLSSLVAALLSLSVSRIKL